MYETVNKKLLKKKKSSTFSIGIFSKKFQNSVQKLQIRQFKKQKSLSQETRQGLGAKDKKNIQSWDDALRFTDKNMTSTFFRHSKERSHDQ